MKCSVTLERWDCPIIKAEPSGFDHIKVSLGEPSNKVEVNATIPLEAAHALGKRLISLSQTLEKAQWPNRSWLKGESNDDTN